MIAYTPWKMALLSLFDDNKKFSLRGGGQLLVLPTSYIVEIFFMDIENGIFCPHFRRDLKKGLYCPYKPTI